MWVYVLTVCVCVCSCSGKGHSVTGDHTEAAVQLCHGNKDLLNFTEKIFTQISEFAKNIKCKV